MPLDPSTLCARTAAGDAELAAPRHGLAIAQRRLLTLLDQPLPLDQLVARPGAQPERIERDLSRLAEHGLVVVHRPAGSTGPAFPVPPRTLGMAFDIPVPPTATISPAASGPMRGGPSSASPGGAVVIGRRVRRGRALLVGFASLAAVGLAVWLFATPSIDPTQPRAPVAAPPPTAPAPVGHAPVPTTHAPAAAAPPGVEPIRVLVAPDPVPDRNPALFVSSAPVPTSPVSAAPAALSLSASIPATAPPMPASPASPSGSPAAQASGSAATAAMGLAAAPVPAPAPAAVDAIVSRGSPLGSQTAAAAPAHPAVPAGPQASNAPSPVQASAVSDGRSMLASDASLPTSPEPAPVARQQAPATASPSAAGNAPANAPPAPAGPPVPPLQLAAAAPATQDLRVAARTLAPVMRETPDFPREAAIAGFRQGTVKARVTVDASGRVSGVEILESQPRRVFDRAVSRSLARWTFEPGAPGRTTDVEIAFRRE
ncbi:MAG: TonB family protein [Betaproteobacteria bacterium]